MAQLSDIEDLLPPKPTAPHPSDCCGTGCCPCVHDIYEQEIKIWKKKCEETRSKEVGEEEDFSIEILSRYKYTNFELTKIKPVTEDTSVYTFNVPNNKNLSVNIGQHIIIRGLVKDKFLVRQYTPISNLDSKGFFELLIKIYPNGKMGSFISQWKVGINIEMRGPFGALKYERNSFKRILMLCAGTGIAPMYQLIKYILDNDNDYTKIHLMYASKKFKDILLRNELKSFLSFWNFTACYFLSNEESMAEKWYLEKVELRKMIKKDVELEILSASVDNLLILICGTKSFQKDMVNASLNAEVNKENIFQF